MKLHVSSLGSPKSQVQTLRGRCVEDLGSALYGQQVQSDLMRNPIYHASSNAGSGTIFLGKVASFTLRQPCYPTPRLDRMSRFHLTDVILCSFLLHC
jgi:hypothetical protein